MLPQEIKLEIKQDSFKRQLKTHLSKQTYDFMTFLYIISGLSINRFMCLWVQWKCHYLEALFYTLCKFGIHEKLVVVIKIIDECIQSFLRKTHIYELM